jgi:tRNA (guanine9-N1)-methyltransferase
LFPRKNLIYLSPDAEFSAHHFKPFKVYIIGGIVDNNAKGEAKYLTLQQAQKEGIRCERLPIFDNLQ